MENAIDMVEDYERLIQNTTHLPGQLLPPTVTLPKGPPVRIFAVVIPAKSTGSLSEHAALPKASPPPSTEARIHSLSCESLPPSSIPERWHRYPLTSVDQPELPARKPEVCYLYATEGSVLFYIVVRELLYMMIGGIYSSGARGSDINTDFSEGIHRLAVGPRWRIGKQQDE